MKRVAFALTCILTAGLSIAETIRANANEPLRSNLSKHACSDFSVGADYVKSTIVMQLEKREINIRVPRGYFEDPWDLVNGFRDTSQLFRVEIDSFLPVSRQEAGKRNKRGIWNWMTFLVGDTVSLSEIARQRADIFNSERPKIESYAVRPSDFGLTWVETKDSSLSRSPRNDLFLSYGSPERMEIETIIQCTSPKDKTSPHPICSQFFRSSGMDVELTYPRSELENWKQLQDDVAHFLSCARVE